MIVRKGGTIYEGRLGLGDQLSRIAFQSGIRSLWGESWYSLKEPWHDLVLPVDGGEEDPDVQNLVRELSPIIR